VRYGVGNYDYYLEKRVAATIDDAGPRKREQAGISDPGYSKARPRKLKWKEERELKGMEAAILNAETEVARLEALFSDPEFYTKHAADFARLEAELRAARDEVARLYARWAELGELAALAEK
jgi:ATP-binding cassette subfamily F protein uup